MGGGGRGGPEARLLGAQGRRSGRDPGPRSVGTLRLRRGTALLGSTASPISARFCCTDLPWSQACRMCELRREASVAHHSRAVARARTRGLPDPEAGPSPLDPGRRLAPSIPVQPLPVDVVAELLPPRLALGLRHGANRRGRRSSPAPRGAGYFRGGVPGGRGLLGNAVPPGAAPDGRAYHSQNAARARASAGSPAPPRPFRDLLGGGGRGAATRLSRR